MSKRTDLARGFWGAADTGAAGAVTLGEGAAATGATAEGVVVAGAGVVAGALVVDCAQASRNNDVNAEMDALRFMATDA